MPQIEPKHVIIKKAIVPHFVYIEDQEHDWCAHKDDITELVKELQDELCSVDWSGDCKHFNHAEKLKKLVHRILRPEYDF
jgi:hypothetical protein